MPFDKKRYSPRNNVKLSDKSKKINKIPLLVIFLQCHKTAVSINITDRERHNTLLLYYLTSISFFLKSDNKKMLF